MSLPAQNVAPQIVAAAGQTVFAFSWRCDDSSLVAVYVNDTLDGGFTVIRNADQTASPGGTITRASACVGGEVVTVERLSPQTQTTSLTRYGAFPADTITNVLDKAIMLSQEAAGILGKCVKVARSQLAKFSSLEIPTAAAGQALAFVADPNDATKVKFGLLDVVSYVDQKLSGFPAVQPLRWNLAGDGATLDFNMVGATVSSSDVYLVTVDGVPQDPASYTVSLTGTPQIHFAEAPPFNALVLVRSQSYAKAASLGSATLVTATGGNTPRALADWHADDINVKGFGAKGDGVQVDGSFIQLAINAVPAAGGTVVIPPGTYKLTSGLTMPNPRVRLLGYGAKLVQTGVLQRGVTITGVNCVVEGLWIYNTNGAAEWVDAPAGSTNAIGIHIGAAADGARIINCRVENFAWSGIRIWQSKRISVQGNEIIGVGLTKPLVAGNNNNLGIELYLSGIGYPDIRLRNNSLHELAQGIYVGYDWANVCIEGNHIQDIQGQHGMYIDGTSSLVVVGNIVKTTGQNGIKVQISSNTTLDAVSIHIGGNALDACGAAGIIALPSQAGLSPRFKSLSIVGNVVRNCQSGIDVDHSDDYNISDNNVYGSSTLGIRTRSENGNGKVAGNVVAETQQSGLYLQATSTAFLGLVDFNYIINPGLSGIGTSDLRAGIYLSTGEWIARHNIIVGTAALGFNFASHASSLVTLQRNRTMTTKNNSLGSVAVTYGRTAVGASNGGTLISNAQTTDWYEVTSSVIATAWTHGVPLNPTSDALLTYMVRNTSGGALGVLTWDVIFKMSAWVQPGTLQSRSITFRWNGTNWVEVSRTAADVPN